MFSFSLQCNCEWAVKPMKCFGQQVAVTGFVFLLLFAPPHCQKPVIEFDISLFQSLPALVCKVCTNSLMELERAFVRLPMFSEHCAIVLLKALGPLLGRLLGHCLAYYAAPCLCEPPQHTLSNLWVESASFGQS